MRLVLEALRAVEDFAGFFFDPNLQIGSAGGQKLQRHLLLSRAFLDLCEASVLVGASL